MNPCAPLQGESDAFRRGRPLRDVRTVPVDHFSYLKSTRSQWCLPVPAWAVLDARRRFLRQLTLERVTLTIRHLAICLLYHYQIIIIIIRQFIWRR